MLWEVVVKSHLTSLLYTVRDSSGINLKEAGLNFSFLLCTTVYNTINASQEKLCAAVDNQQWLHLSPFCDKWALAASECWQQQNLVGSNFTEPGLNSQQKNNSSQNLKNLLPMFL